MSWDVYIGLRLQRPRTPLATLASLGEQPWFKVEVLHSDYLRRARLSRQAAGDARLPLAVFDELRRLTNDLEPAAEGWIARPRFELDRGVVEFEHRGVLRCRTPGFCWPAIGESGYDAVYDAGDHKHYSPSLRGRAAERNLTLLVEESAALLALGVRELRGLDAERSPDPGGAWLVHHSSPDGYLTDLHQLGHPAGSLDDRTVLDAALHDETVGVEPTTSGPIIYSTSGIRGRLEGFYQRLARACC